MTKCKRWQKYLTDFSMFQVVGFSTFTWIGYFTQKDLSLQMAFIVMFGGWIAGCLAAWVCWNDVPKGDF